MSKREKLLRRLASRPKDFTWAELVSLMMSLEFEMESGSGSGSGRKFVNPATEGTLFIHEPYPAKLLKSYQMRDAIHFLKKEGLLS